MQSCFFNHKMLYTLSLGKKMKYFWTLLMLLGLAGAQSVFADEPLLDPEVAFRVQANMGQAGIVNLHWKVVEGYYLYRQKFEFKLPQSCVLDGADLPAGKMKNDEFFGQMEVYGSDFAAQVRHSGCTPSHIQVTHQGCSDLGVCFPPMTSNLALAGITTVNASGELPTDGGSARPRLEETSPQDTATNNVDVEQLLQRGSIALILTSFFGFGLALALTPCVFPMIPILSGIIVKQGSAISRSRAALLSGAYVLGMALTYSLAGVAAGMSGTMLSVALQNPWVLGSFAALFVVLALSMFGLFELQLPATLQSRLASVSGSRSGSAGGIAMMGALSALIIGPCIAPPLAGALLYIAKTGNAQLGGLALFVMALGMGLPLMLVGTFSREILPKAGGWMNAVNKGFGVALLATALWIVSPVLPNWILMVCAAALLIVTAIFLSALDPLPVRTNGWLRMWKGVGVGCLVAGCSLLIGVLSGSRDILQPLAHFQSVSSATREIPRFERINSVKQLQAKIAAADRPVLLDFYADWCVSCKEMERYTFADPAVKDSLSKFLLLKADVTANNPEHKELMKHFSLFGPPAIVFFDKKGAEKLEKRVIGFMPAERFGQLLLSIQQ
jgi:thiol:disulfide interchange protein DsbD